MIEDIVIPIVNRLNGDKPEVLIQQIVDVHEAARTLDEALSQMTPNGRNYIGEPERLDAARKQHSARRQTVASIIKDVEIIGRGIQKQSRGA
jgi:hypothetical protein